MFFGVALLVLGGFLLGGAYSVWTAGGDPQAGERSGPRVAIAAVLLLAAVLATAGGVLYLV